MITKLQSILDDEFSEGIYFTTDDTVLNDWKKFQNFLHWNLKCKYDRFKEVGSVSNHPGKIYVNPKTYNFDSLKDIEIEHQLKLLKMKHISHGFLIYPAKETSDYIIHQIYIEK